MHVFKRTLLTEQGIAVPSGRGVVESEDYFTADAWDYLGTCSGCAGGTPASSPIGAEYDRATRQTYTNVRRFDPAYRPHPVRSSRTRPAP